jgi:hypothetical protein
MTTLSFKAKNGQEVNVIIKRKRMPNFRRELLFFILIVFILTGCIPTGNRSINTESEKYKFVIHVISEYFDIELNGKTIIGYGIISENELDKKINSEIDGMKAAGLSSDLEESFRLGLYLEFYKYVSEIYGEHIPQKVLTTTIFRPETLMASFKIQVKYDIKNQPRCLYACKAANTDDIYYIYVLINLWAAKN